jgi:hypothetical protein
MTHNVGDSLASRQEHFEPGMTPLGIQQKRMAEMGYLPDSTLAAPRNTAPIPGARSHAPHHDPSGVQENFFFGMPYDGEEPPDVSIAAGPYQILAVDNSQLRAYDKTGDLRWWTTLNIFGL